MTIEPFNLIVQVWSEKILFPNSLSHVYQNTQINSLEFSRLEKMSINVARAWLFGEVHYVKSKLNLFTCFHFYRCFIALFLFSLFPLYIYTVSPSALSLFSENEIRKFFPYRFAFKSFFLTKLHTFFALENVLKLKYYFLSSRMLSRFSLRGDWMSTLTHNKVLYNSKSLAAKNFFSLALNSFQSLECKNINENILTRCRCVGKRSLKWAERRHEYAICVYSFSSRTHNTQYTWNDECMWRHSLSLSSYRMHSANDIMRHNVMTPRSIS